MTPSDAALTDEQTIARGLDEFRAAFAHMQRQLQQVIVGQDEVVRHVLTAAFLQGHVLLEGVPGLGKTLLMTTLGDVLGLRVARVQFTPDLMPADILGTRILQQDEKGAASFTFEPGPVFTQVLLADEINRATPKTQSALLEAMQERKVTVAGQTYRLPEPFLVLATQNPIEQEGTYPLPEAQLDRFLFKILVRFPTQLELMEIMRRTTGATVARAQRVLESPDQVLAWGALLRQVPIATPVLDFAARLLLATHPGGGGAPGAIPSAGGAGAGGDGAVTKWVRFGASPRGLQAMVLAAKLRAVLDGRFAVSRADLIDVAKPCLRHRVLLTFEAESEGISADEVIEQVIRKMT